MIKKRLINSILVFIQFFLNSQKVSIFYLSLSELTCLLTLNRWPACLTISHFCHGAHRINKTNVRVVSKHIVKGVFAIDQF